MSSLSKYLVNQEVSLEEVMLLLNEIVETILFVVDNDNLLLGSITDGDIRRGMLKGYGMNDGVLNFIQAKPRTIQKDDFHVNEIIHLRNSGIYLIPVLDRQGKVINIINLHRQSSFLPVDALIMAGGYGSRLKPLTDQTPKPLLQVGEKPIIDHNVDRLAHYGISEFHISVRYKGEQIEQHFLKRKTEGVNFNIIWEDNPLGTLGAASLIEHFENDYVLISNSDILTNLNYEDFFLDFITKDADMSVVTIPYEVNVPYAVLDTVENQVISFQEKPTYTFFSNGGIYLIKRELLNLVPKGKFYNSTDLMEDLISNGGKLISFPMRNYWLDIGRPEDFEKAQKDIKHIGL